MPELSIHSVTKVGIHAASFEQDTKCKAFDMTRLLVSYTTNKDQLVTHEITLYSKPGTITLHSQEVKPDRAPTKFNVVAAATCADLGIERYQLHSVYIDTVIDQDGEHEESIPDWVFDLAKSWLGDLTNFEATIAMQLAYSKYCRHRPGSLLPTLTDAATRQALICLGMQAVRNSVAE